MFQRFAVLRIVMCSVIKNSLILILFCMYRESTLLGWCLMKICLVTFSPTSDFRPYLTKHIQGHSLLAKDELATYAKECLYCLSESLKHPPRVDLPTTSEINAIQVRGPITLKFETQNVKTELCRITPRLKFPSTSLTIAK